jgi:hypothetical protein
MNNTKNKISFIGGSKNYFFQHGSLQTPILKLSIYFPMKISSEDGNKTTNSHHPIIILGKSSSEQQTENFFSIKVFLEFSSSELGKSSSSVRECVVVKQNAEDNSLECHLPSLWTPDDQESSSTIFTSNTTAFISLWLSSQPQAPIYVFPPSFNSHLNQNKISVDRASRIFSSKTIELSIRPSFPAAFSQEQQQVENLDSPSSSSKSKRASFEVLAQLTSQRFSPEYLGNVQFVIINGGTSSQSKRKYTPDFCSWISQSSSNSSLNSNPLLIPLMLSSSSSSSIINPIQFHQLYSCSAILQKIHPDSPFFVAACSSLSEPFSVQLALLRPPRFHQLHITSFDDFSAFENNLNQEEITNAERRNRLASHSPHEIIKIPSVCFSSSDSTSSSSTSTAIIHLELTKKIRLGVTINVALHSDEASAIEKLLAEADDETSGNNNAGDSSSIFTRLRKKNLIFATVTSFRFSATPDCASPIRGLDALPSDIEATKVQIQTSGTGGGDSSSSSSSRPFLALHFSSREALNVAKIVEREIFPLRTSYICVKWNQTSSSSRNTKKTLTRIATAKLGFCRGGENNNNHKDRSSQQKISFSEHCQNEGRCDFSENMCVCGEGARGPWCERKCPTSKKNLQGQQQQQKSVCSSQGTCNKNAECECNINHFGPSCSDQLQRDTTNDDDDDSSAPFEAKNSAEFLIDASSSLFSSKSIKPVHLSLLRNQYSNKNSQVVLSSVSHLLQPSRQLKVSVSILQKEDSSSSSSSWKELKDITASSSIVFWYDNNNNNNNNNNFKNNSTSISESNMMKSPLTTRSAVGAFSKNKILSPTYSSPRVDGEVPFNVISLYLFSNRNDEQDLKDKPNDGQLTFSLFQQILQNANNNNNNNKNSKFKIKVVVETGTDFYDTTQRGCESGVCAVIAIFVGLAAGFLGFAGTHIALQMKNKDYKQFVESKKQLIMVERIKARILRSDHREEDNSLQ